MPKSTASGQKTVPAHVNESIQNSLNESPSDAEKNLSRHHDVSSGAPDRQKMVELQAYYLAEKEGFTPGRETEHWFEAERLVDEHLKSSTQLTSSTKPAKPARKKTQSRVPKDIH